MAAENNNSWAWEIFLRLLCEEGSGEATRESGIYRLIIERFPIQLMQKLLSTAVDNSIEQSDDRIGVGEHAAGVMIELNDVNLLERNYARIEDTQTLDSRSGFGRAESKNWEIFLRLLCESREETRESGLYKLIIEHFPIQFMQKLLSTAVDVTSTHRVRKHAASVMVELNDDDLLRKNYSKIDDAQTLDSLRRHALHLTVDYEVGSTLQVCGEQTALKLARQSLELDQERWDVLLDFAEECFTSVTASTADNLDRLLAIFRGLPWHLRDELVRIMKPRIAVKSEQFEDTMIQLLYQASDDSPFLLLPSIIRAFDQTISPAITQAAITTGLFTDTRSAYFALQVAEIYIYCIQHTSLTNPFPFSGNDFGIMSRRIDILTEFLEDYSEEVPLRLLVAFVEKFSAYFS